MRHVGWSASFFSCSLGLLACSGTVTEPEELAGEAQQALVDASAVLGFESAEHWSASAGTKSSSNVVTQGSAALGISNVYYTELTSAPLGSLAGVSSTVTFDFRPGANLAWGQAQLYIDAPSRGVHMTYLGQVDLAGSVGGVYRPLTFSLPPSVVAALSRGSYSDLRFKIALNSPAIAAPHLLDNLRFGGGSSTPASVTLDVSGVDDFLYVTVGGVRRQVFPIGPESSRDVSSWFAGGDNSVRIQAINTGGPASYSVQLRVNGQLVIDESCASAPCESSVTPGAGIVFDHTYTVAAPHRPAAQTVTVNGTAGGKLYLNDAYTGLSLPASLTLPQGTYTVGVGVGEGTENAYVGQYFEQSVVVAGSPVTVNATGGAPLDQPNHHRVAILPIRTTFHGDQSAANTGVLNQRDVAVMTSQAIATRDVLFEPFSYNLSTWDIDVLPVVENVALHRGPLSGDVPDTGRFLYEAGLESLNASYDTVVFLFSRFTATGDGVVNSPCCFWGGGQQVIFMNHMTRGGWGDDYPNVYLLHEFLHDYESYNDGRLHFYIGADGLHGGEEHGYHGGDNGESDFLQWQRRFMRNQVAELDTMRSGVEFSGPPPSSADLWTGVFDTMRRDVSWSAASASSSSTPAPLAQPAPDVRGTPVPTSPTR